MCFYSVSWPHGYVLFENKIKRGHLLAERTRDRARSDPAKTTLSSSSRNENAGQYLANHAWHVIKAVYTELETCDVFCTQHLRELGAKHSSNQDLWHHFQAAEQVIWARDFRFSPEGFYYPISPNKLK